MSSIASSERMLYGVRSPGVSRPAALTAAEANVLLELVAGRTNAEIANIRHTSVRTVVNQVTAVFTKFGIGSRRELVALAVDLWYRRPRSTMGRHGLIFAYWRSIGPLGDANASNLQTLTARERRVVAYMASGYSNKVIGYELGLSPGTVSAMLARATAKLRKRTLGYPSRPR
jgi:DNA-binding CsgD family transcriptional regulator